MMGQAIVRDHFRLRRLNAKDGKRKIWNTQMYAPRPGTAWVAEARCRCLRGGAIPRLNLRKEMPAWIDLLPPGVALGDSEIH